ncbi:protein claret segregational [Aethina tumida]|uniref:protein claret segregational n=1 Tax=Aethina tumida TaxID=116153 RepID=UPI002149555B|nr:protein claret segregational [Aethina tumida]
MDTTTSKLPKPSKLPTMKSAVPIPKPSKPPLQTLSTGQRLIRRSKSFSDLSNLTKVESIFERKKPLMTIPENKINNSKLRRRSKSITDISKTAPKKTISKENKMAPTKRPAQKPPAGESKPKIAKQASLPSWDYKGRFQQLSEKYSAQQESLKNMKDRLSGLSEIEDNYEKLQTDLEKLHTENIGFSKTIKTYESELGILRPIKPKYETLLTEHEIVEKEYSQLKSKHEILVEKEATTSELLTKTTEENKVLQDKYGKLKSDYDIICVEKENLSISLEEQLKKNADLENMLRILTQRLQENTAQRRLLHNTIQDLKGNIRVIARVRPPINSEEEDRIQCVINYIDENCLEIRKTRESISVSGKIQDLKQEFTFDKVFGPESTQLEVFEELAQLIQSALDGYNVCVFAYGQTGSGKTHTMQGSDTNPEHFGMIPRTIDMIFDTIHKLEKEGWTYKVHASFLEIYNENVRDLLDHKSNKVCEIRYNEGKGTTVTNLTIQPIESAKELRHYMRVSHKNRAVAATDFNEHSSRSHAVTKIYLECSHQESNSVYSGSVNLVDLAGSESAKTSANDRIVETKNINKSLSCLGTVMLALCNKENHVPYRNSKLTYLLQSCLGGNSKTLMFVNIAPFEENYLESINSLRFASRVKEVKLQSKKVKLASNIK